MRDQCRCHTGRFLRKVKKSQNLQIQQTDLKIDQVVGQLNCASNRFISEAATLISAKRAEIININEEFLDKTTGSYHYKINVEKGKAFLGVKAVVFGIAREQIPYIPLQISSLYGSLEKVSVETFIIIGIYLGVIIFVVITVSTRCARRGYRPISTNEQ